MSNGLPAALLGLKKDAPLGFAIGVVTDDSPLTVQINGEPTDIVNPPLVGAVPAIDDVVFCLRPGAGIVVLGATGTTVLTPGGDSSVLPYHAVGTNWSFTATTELVSTGDDSCVLNAVVPAEGNLFVTGTCDAHVDWVVSPPDTTRDVSWNFSFFVDGSGPSFGYDTINHQERVFTQANGTFERGFSLTTIIACPAADTREVRLNINVGVGPNDGHHNVATVSTPVANLYALWVAGTALSDGGDFTP